MNQWELVLKNFNLQAANPNFIKMDTSTIIFFVVIFLYPASLAATILNKKLGGISKKVFKIINLVALILTIILVFLWSFNKHPCNLTMEIIPFWTFVISAIIVFGLTATNKMEKLFYGIIFYGNLFLAVILIIPFFGLGITSMIYAPFLPHHILYEDQKVILTEESRGFLAPKPSPTVYIKCGFFLQKYETTLSPVFSLDSVSLKKIDNQKIEITIHRGKDSNLDRQDKQTLDCNCL